MLRKYIRFAFCSNLHIEPKIPDAEFTRLKQLQTSFKEYYALKQYREALS